MWSLVDEEEEESSESESDPESELFDASSSEEEKASSLLSLDRLEEVGFSCLVVDNGADVCSSVSFVSFVLLRFPLDFRGMFVSW